MIRPLDHLLMNLWVVREAGHDRDAALHGQHILDEEERAEMVEEALREGLIAADGAGWALTEAGEAEARRLVRRHRLAERLLSDLLELPETEFETTACRFEHFLSDVAADRICTLLGHPTRCPHGEPIPNGDCCRDRLRSVSPIVERLSDLEPGSEARIVFLSPTAGERLGKLAGLGLVPGSRVKLKRKTPAYVFDCGTTEVAADEEIVREIYVSRVGEGAGR